jgi:hypothetical protein
MVLPLSSSEVQVNGAPRLEDLSRDELIELLEARGEGGIREDFQLIPLGLFSICFQGHPSV